MSDVRKDIEKRIENICAGDMRIMFVTENASGARRIEIMDEKEAKKRTGDMVLNDFARRSESMWESQRGDLLGVEEAPDRGEMIIDGTLFPFWAVTEIEWSDNAALVHANPVWVDPLGICFAGTAMRKSTMDTLLQTIRAGGHIEIDSAHEMERLLEGVC